MKNNNSGLTTPPPELKLPDGVTEKDIAEIKAAEQPKLTPDQEAEKERLARNSDAYDKFLRGQEAEMQSRAADMLRDRSEAMGLKAPDLPKPEDPTKGAPLPEPLNSEKINEKSAETPAPQPKQEAITVEGVDSKEHSKPTVAIEPEEAKQKPAVAIEGMDEEARKKEAQPKSVEGPEKTLEKKKDGTQMYDLPPEQKDLIADKLGQNAGKQIQDKMKDGSLKQYTVDGKGNELDASQIKRIKISKFDKDGNKVGEAILEGDAKDKYVAAVNSGDKKSMDSLVKENFQATELGKHVAEERDAAKKGVETKKPPALMDSGKQEALAAAKETSALPSFTDEKANAVTQALNKERNSQQGIAG